MTGWVIGGVYLSGYLATWRTIVYFSITYLAYGKIDGEAIVFGTIIGTIICFFWPLVCVGMLVKRIYGGRSEEVVLLFTPRGQKRKTVLAERERRIKELEHELEIK